MKEPLKLTPEQEKTLHWVKNHAPSKYGLFLRCFQGVLGRMGAIKVKCLDCGDVTVDEVRFCPATNCPLWHYRPYQTKQKKD